MTARLSVLVTIVTLVFAAGIPSHALAQQKSLRDRAKVHVGNGQALQEAKQYPEALSEYQQAYDLVPHPELLFNMGQVNRLMGEHAEAVRLYEKYLALEPNGRAADQAKQFIEESRTAMAEADARAKEAAAEAERKKKLDAARQQPDPGPDGSTPAGTTEPQVIVDDPPPATSGGSGGKGLKVFGLVAGIVGVASVGAGVFFGLEAQRLSDELSDGTGPWTDDDLAKEADGRAAERNMFIFTGVGAAAIVAGGALYFLGRSKDRAAARGLSVAPVFGPSSATVSISGAF
jgi:tetratricopeptide (TPR) repeat protein